MQAKSLTLARQMGRLRAMLRNSAEQADADRLSLSSLQQLEDDRSSTSQVESGRGDISCPVMSVGRGRSMLLCLLLLLDVASAAAQNFRIEKIDRSNKVDSEPAVATRQARVDEPGLHTRKLDMFVGEIKVYQKEPITRVAVGNDRVVRVQVLDDNELLIIAHAEGSSSLRLWHQGGSQSDYNIRVSARDPEARFHTEKMITMRVRLVEFRKSALTRLGIDWSDAAGGRVLATAGDLVPGSQYRPSSEIADASPADSIKPFSSDSGITSSISSHIDFLSSSGDAVLLAEPILSCASGGTARFLAGGEVPYPLRGANGQTTIDFREYGIRLEVSPHLDTAGHIQTRVLAEFSSIDPAVSVQGAPGLLTRRTQTQVKVRSGETIVIAGLLNSENSRNADKLPGIARLPVIGSLLQSQKLRDEVTELVIFITPEVDTPESAAPVPRQRKVELFSNARLSDAARRLLRQTLD